MERLWRVFVLTLVLAISSFLVGILPLSFTFSNKRKSQLSTFGNGLLLGAALGVIIPEGIEAASTTPGTIPTSTIALSLLVGFALMLVVEQCLVPHQPPGTKLREHFPVVPSEQEYDMHSIDTERSGLSHDVNQNPEHLTGPNQNHHHIMVHPLTLGLVIHSLADGLALGASAASEDSSNMTLSLVVFFALIIHKSPTALALTSSLLSTSLPRSEIRKHVAFFSVATPLGAIFSFAFLEFVGPRAVNLPGIGLLISGGTFLYVATVVHPINTHLHDSLPIQDFSNFERVLFLLLGIFIPFAIGSLFEHGHNLQRA